MSGNTVKNSLHCSLNLYFQHCFSFMLLPNFFFFFGVSFLFPMKTTENTFPEEEGGEGYFGYHLTSSEGCELAIKQVEVILIAWIDSKQFK